MRSWKLLNPGLALVLVACSGPEQPEQPAELPPAVVPLPSDTALPPDTMPAPAAWLDVHVYFSRGEERQRVVRQVPGTGQELRYTLEELVRGPSPEERAAGLSSWFSEATVGVVRRVELQADGRAVVDFADLRALIPGASSSAGSEMLLGELNATVFQFESVQEVLYRIDGDCDLFWEWLQRECQVVRRPRS